MGCCSRRDKRVTVTEEQTWDSITLSDFRSNSCFTPFSYMWLWVLVLVSCAVYVADAFTAVNLLAFNKWSSQVKPKVPFEVAKWIFAITIIVSYVFLIYRWIRALHVMRSRSVTECYLEPMAAIIQSMRLTRNGQGWRRFLVFAELTKSKKGANYIALFVYFQFKGALILTVAQGPRIAINAMTLYAVMQAQLVPVGSHASKERSSFAQFFFNFKTLVATDQNKQEIVIYFSMLFSLVIWVLSALSLFVAFIFYIFFLWHYIPRADGSLTQYCRRKVETRLERIVGKKIKKAIEKQDQHRRRQEQKAIKKGNLDATQTRPTLPKLAGDDDGSSAVFSLQRSDTMSTNTTLPPYAPGAHVGSETMSTNSSTTKPSPLGDRAGMLTRTNTMATNFSHASYSSNAPLLNQDQDYFGDQFRPYTPNGRPFTPTSNGRASPAPSRGPLPPVDTSYASNRLESDPYRISPMSNDLRAPSSAASSRHPEFSPFNTRGPQMGNQVYEMSPVDADNRSYYPNSAGIDEYQVPQLPSILRAGSPAMSVSSNVPPPRAGTAPPRPGVPASLQPVIQRRETSNPLPNRGMMNASPQQRSATAPIRQPNYTPGPRSFTPNGQRPNDHDSVV